MCIWRRWSRYSSTDRWPRVVDFVVGLFRSAAALERWSNLMTYPGKVRYEGAIKKFLLHYQTQVKVYRACLNAKTTYSVLKREIVKNDFSRKAHRKSTNYRTPLGGRIQCCRTGTIIIKYSPVSSERERVSEKKAGFMPLLSESLFRLRRKRCFVRPRRPWKLPGAGSSYQIKRRPRLLARWCEAERRAEPRVKRRKEVVLGLTDVRTDRSPSQISSKKVLVLRPVPTFFPLFAPSPGLYLRRPYSLFPIRSSLWDLLSYLTRPSLRSFRHV